MGPRRQTQVVGDKGPCRSSFVVFPARLLREYGVNSLGFTTESDPSPSTATLQYILLVLHSHPIQPCIVVFPSTYCWTNTALSDSKTSNLLRAGFAEVGCAGELAAIERSIGRLFQASHRPTPTYITVD